MSEDPIPYSAAPRTLIPVLQVPREDFRRGVRDTLYRLHQERFWNQDQQGRAILLAEIAFWEAVLGWIKEQAGDHVNLMGRAR